VHVTWRGRMSTPAKKEPLPDAGWYPDPFNDLRYWDGTRWTAQVGKVKLIPPMSATGVGAFWFNPQYRAPVNLQFRRGI
jgi:Protein of unknown function (DUF2510)